jgi:hypothetical protein
MADRPRSTISRDRGELFSFLRGIGVGDLVVLPQPQGRFAVGRVTGEYGYRPDLPRGANHTRPVEWLRRDLRPGAGRGVMRGRRSRQRQGESCNTTRNMTRLREGDVIVHYARGVVRSVSRVSAAAVEAPRPSELPQELWGAEGYLARLDSWIRARARALFRRRAVRASNRRGRALPRMHDDADRRPTCNRRVHQGLLSRITQSQVAELRLGS